MTSTASSLHRSLAMAVEATIAPMPSSALLPQEGETTEHRAARKHHLLPERLAANRDINHLTPIMLNACRKAEAGNPLTDLESDLLDLARLAAPTRSDLFGYGTAYTELGEGGRAALFPDRIAELTIEDSCTYEQVSQEVADYWPVISQLPNVAFHEPGMRPQDMPSGEVVQRYGWSRIIPPRPLPEAGRGKGQAASGPVGAADASRDPMCATVHVVRAKCHEHTWGEPGTDEVYFTLQVTDGDPDYTFDRTTKTVEGFKKGVTKDYNQPVVAWMHDDEVDELPVTNVWIAIQGWEEDHGKSDLVKKIGEKARDISEKLIKGVKDPTKKGDMAKGIGGIILAIVSLLTQWWHDDYIGQNFLGPWGPDIRDERSFNVLVVQYTPDGHEAKGSGKYEVTLKATHECYGER